MGDAADDMYDAVIRAEVDELMLLSAGCMKCMHPEVDADGVCTKCDGTGWLDSDGNPVET